eukprot:1154462-Pelagomonas_calceolata.AAC.2
MDDTAKFLCWEQREGLEPPPPGKGGLQDLVSAVVTELDLAGVQGWLYVGRCDGCEGAAGLVALVGLLTFKQLAQWA